MTRSTRSSSPSKPARRGAAPPPRPRQARLCILGGGNIGRAMAAGLVAAGRYRPQEIVLTRRRLELLDDLAREGFQTQSDNAGAVARSQEVIVAVEPHHLDEALHSIAGALQPQRHLLISVVSGARIADIARQVPPGIAVVRAMPNTAIALGQSMTCVATNAPQADVLRRTVEIFDAVGRTVIIAEEQMGAATALCACGIAFFLRAVRAASQGGIEIGFHPDEALLMAAQTALGAASLIVQRRSHPEREIDSVTTPRGCTIAGLNEMEHQGLSSALIKGIVTSARKADALYARPS